MSTHAKLSLAEMALQLRDEQLNARIVHYRADLQTNSELDAITAQVVSELQQMQAVRLPSVPPPDDRSNAEIALIASLKEMLSRLFRPDKLVTLIERKMTEISKRFARLFFESELHERHGGDAPQTKTMRFAEQALFHVLARNEPYLSRQLEEFDYLDPEALVKAKRELALTIRTLRDDFLARTTPELNALVKILNEVLGQFFTKELPPIVGELAWEVVREARLADARLHATYKISATAFPLFRQFFERRFLQRLIAFAEDELVRRVRERGSPSTAETLRFLAEPRIFTDICELICDAVYDFLYNDGFLDLPGDWKAHLRQG